MDSYSVLKPTGFKTALLWTIVSVSLVPLGVGYAVVSIAEWLWGVPKRNPAKIKANNEQVWRNNPLDWMLYSSDTKELLPELFWSLRTQTIHLFSPELWRTCDPCEGRDGIPVTVFLEGLAKRRHLEVESFEQIKTGLCGKAIEEINGGAVMDLEYLTGKAIIFIKQNRLNNIWEAVRFTKTGIQQFSIPNKR